jgi:2-polyprenyl-6-methoxyphenol hydroxylase-like FAD-dependent oxidoreductase
MEKPLAIIAGGGIGGLAAALTLQQIGVPCVVFEATGRMRPLGVGINLQPNAVRELYDLGISAEELDKVGVPAREWALVGLNGNDIYCESRGLLAGYRWPQYAVHRGLFHMLLHRKFVERAGPECFRPGSRVTGYSNNAMARISVSTALFWSVATVSIPPSGRKCIPTSRRSIGEARSCGAALPGQSPSEQAPPSSVWEPIATVW